ncbi:MAG TPA: 2-succinyl-5-enolpyruvyl-6-hydroxy-3-cyclohexene-1-carboxylic-acid synthase [Solirubrobacteraceae bacterium]|jgi:2-succinyl-5-enolpyruvyl-6-hydroxy-3-cyclohexene-1-carboxylate synthase|nr:2-succinyl-5-enolpyruvyl-6-hydroxy-3-cyclohexene-1-carboxylic-acid synthase [Solirubrobacteraceae bacterium]
MTPATETYLLLAAFVDELARCGMRAACTSPGSRCAPLVLTLAGDARLRCFSHVDERCAGFFALGLAKSSGLPVAVACTSGTAAAELLPAAIEAREARVPLLLLTADRPPELRDNGAGQAIDQLKLYGDAAKWFFEVGVDRADEQRLRWMRTLACRAYWTALDGRPGVVHLNFPLREPLVIDEELPPDDTGRPQGLPYVRRVSPSSGSSAAASTLGALVAGARRGVLVAGRHERGTPLGQAAAAFAAAAGWPLLADPLSGARRGDAAIAHYDALLRDEGFLAGVRPDLVLRVGDLPVSKPLRTWLAGLRGVRQVALDPEAAWQDPAAVLSDMLPLEPASTLTRLAGSLADPSAAEPSVEEDWLALWRSADEQASEAILGELGDHRLSEPAVAGELGVLLPEGATLFVASSMPVRDIETFWPVRADPPRVLCNRGANGIDGTVSSAFGAAADANGPIVLLIGDVALAHDIGGLLARRRLGLKLTIVLLDNEGGGIFDFLAVARSPLARSPLAGAPGDAPEATEDVYTSHIATPTGLDFGAAGAVYGFSHERVEDVFEFRAALEASLEGAREASIIEVRTSRDENVELHRRLWRAVSRALSPPGAEAAPTA